MQDYRTADGERRLWFDDAEIEEIMAAELRKAGLAPTAAQPVTDLERLVESYLGCVLDQYAELPGAVLGVSEFRAGESPTVYINKDLTGSALDEEESPSGVLGRWRATMAHEAAHVVLHRVLFEIDPAQLQLVPRAGAGDAELRCLKRNVGYRPRASDWREVQANKGMAALLMPARVFTRVARSEAVRMGFAAATVEPGTEEGRLLTAALAERFQVSRQATEIRLTTTGVIASGGQATLTPF